MPMSKKGKVKKAAEQQALARDMQRWNDDHPNLVRLGIRAWDAPDFDDLDRRIGLMFEKLDKSEDIR